MCQGWNWRATFTDCRRQVFYVSEEICDSPSPESDAAHSLFMEQYPLSFSTIGVSYIFCAICYAIACIGTSKRLCINLYIMVPETNRCFK